MPSPRLNDRSHSPADAPATLQPAPQQTLISSTYNYPVHEAAAIRARESLDIRNAKVVHFNTYIKPWLADTVLDWTRAMSGSSWRRPPSGCG